MKLLIVFVSALVLVAQGKAAPFIDEERFNEVQSEEVAGNTFVDAGQEAGGEGLQGAFAEEAPAQGKAAPFKDEERFSEDQSEGVAGYNLVDAGQEAGIEGLQRAFAEEGPAVYEPQVVGAGPEQRAFLVADPAAERHIYGAPESLYIPLVLRSCSNSTSMYICNYLGYLKGVCVSDATCQCSS